MRKRRVPIQNAPRELEMYRILSSDDGNDSLDPSEVLGTTNEIIVVNNSDGTITLSLDPNVGMESTRRSFFYGRIY